MNAVVGIFMTFVGEVSGDHRACEGCVPEVALDEPRMHAGFEQMGGVGMPTRFDIMLYLMDNSTASRC
jgi:hypothetical protein